MVKAVAGFAAEAYKENNSWLGKLWQDIFDDLGLDKGKNWEYVRGVIWEKKQEKGEIKEE